MLAGSAGFKTAVEGVDYWVAEQITLTLPGGVYPDVTLVATSVEIQAATTTDLPDQSRMQVGYPKITARFTLAGQVDQTDETKTAAWLFRRWNTTSPLYRSDALHAAVTIDIGLYPAGAGGTPELIRKFTGFVDSYTTSPDGSVSFSCEDNHTLLRSIPDTPAVVTAPPYNAQLTSEYALDSILRAASSGVISSWPAQRPQCVLAVGMRGSMWPEVGALADSATIGGDQLIPGFAAGVFGTALNTLSTTATTTSYANLVYILSSGDLGTRAFVEFWVDDIDASSLHFLSLSPASIAFNEIYMKVKSTGITIGVVGFSGNEFTWATPIDGNPHYIAASIVVPAVGGTVSSATLYLDGASRATGTLNWGGPRDAVPMNALWLSTDGHGTIEALQVTTETSPVPNSSFAPQAVLDPSLNALEVVPAVSGDPWAIIQQIADAELAVAGFDETGVFRFYNRNTIKAAPIARTITSATSLATLEEESLSAAVINRGQVGSTSWNFGAPSAVWSLDSVWRIPKRSTGAKTFVRYATVTDGSLFTSVDTTVAFMNDAGTTTAGHSYYRTSIDAAGTADHSGVTIVLTQVTSNKVRIEITNATSQDCYLVASGAHAAPAAGTPVLIIGGTPVTQANETQVDYQYPAVAAGGAATSRFGEVGWQQTGNPWIQDGESALELAQDVVLDGNVPRPNLTNITITPDPRLQLIDVVHIVDPDTTYVDEYARIFGWTLSLANAAWSMTADGRSLAAPGGWIGEVAGRSEGELTTYGY